MEERVGRLELPWSARGIDPYGVSRDELVRWMSLLAAAYRWFGVRTVGIEHVPPRGRALLIGNHSGGVALDGAMVLTSMIMAMEPPRLAHAMVEKFLNVVPFASQFSSRTGQLTGVPETAERLLEDERLLLVFPEGARGTAKLYWERHSLVEFGTGFMRLALQTKSPIVPFAFLGGGEAIPTVANLYRLGKLLGAPYIPVTPWIFPIPRRVPLTIVYSEPMVFEGSATEEDAVIERMVGDVKARIASLIDRHKNEHKGGLA